MKLSLGEIFDYTNALVRSRLRLERSVLVITLQHKNFETLDKVKREEMSLILGGDYIVLMTCYHTTGFSVLLRKTQFANALRKRSKGTNLSLQF